MSPEDYSSEADFEYESEGAEGDEAEAEPEAGDESFSTEADEGDEGDEADEGVYAAEADEADEGDEAEGTIGESMEADEADEADEGDEGFVEAIRMTASARLRARQERSRRAALAWQRVEARKAASAQRALTSRIRSIPIARRTKVASVGTLQGAGVVTAILPNGRRTRMRIIPTVAPISEVNRLRSVVLANEKRQAAAIATNAKAVTSLANAQTATLKRMTAAQLKSDKDINSRLVASVNRLDARITKELSGGSGILDKHSKRMAKVLKRERRRAIMNNVLLATSVPFFLAHGDRDTPFTIDNAILTGSTLFWLLGDDVLSSWASKKGALQGAASVWSYGAPIANGAGLHFWFRNKENRDFIAGVTDVDLTTGAQFPVSGVLKKDAKKTDMSGHAVVATIVDSGTPGTVSAHLTKEGNLHLTVGSVVGSVRDNKVKVAWLVNTKPIAEAIPE